MKGKNGISFDWHAGIFILTKRIFKCPDHAWSQIRQLLPVS